MMSEDKKKLSLRALFLITNPKSADKGSEIFLKNSIPIHYKLHALGTASSEMMDILGLGSPEKTILISFVPKAAATTMLRKFKRELKLGSVNSGIAFTIPLNAASNLIVRMMESMPNEPTSTRKDTFIMSDNKFSLIAAIVNPGCSEDVMEIARSAGARGGTLLHSHRLGKQETVGFWGLSLNEEREIILIITSEETKLKIMQTISEKCGMHSEAQGVFLSLPVEAALGLAEENVE